MAKQKYSGHNYFCHQNSELASSFPAKKVEVVPLHYSMGFGLIIIFFLLHIKK